MKVKFTRYQVPRGAMADAEAFNRMYLIKNVSSLRATYQIRLLAFKAVETGQQLVLRVPHSCVFHSSLDELMASCGKRMTRENY